jgi:hypothetical protein
MRYNVFKIVGLFAMASGLVTGLLSCSREMPALKQYGTSSDSLNYQLAKRKVLIIGIDGAVGDAVKKADAPNMQALTKHAVYSYDVLIDTPTTSATAYASLFTGVRVGKHEVKDNTFSGNKLSEYPLVFDYLKATNSNINITGYTTWDPLFSQYLLAGATKSVNLPGKDADVRDSVVNFLKTGTPDFLFCNFSGVNKAGKDYGYGDAYGRYMQAITTVDGYIGKIYAAVQERETKYNEDWVILIVSDHGGNGALVGGTTEEERNTFYISYNKKFNSRQLAKSALNTVFARFDNYNSGASSTDPAFNPDQYAQFTIELKIRTGRIQCDEAIATNKDWNSGGNPGWLICLQGNQGWRWQTGNGQGERNDYNPSAPPLSDNQWHHIAAVMDNASRKVNLYQDGVLVMSKDTHKGPLNSNKTKTLAVGEDITGGYSSAWCSGSKSAMQLGDIRFWKTGLDSGTIRKYSCGPIDETHPNLDDLVASWMCNDGNGNKLKDQSPLRKDLDFFGSPTWEDIEAGFCGTTFPKKFPLPSDGTILLMNWMKAPVKDSWNMDGIITLPDFY